MKPSSSSPGLSSLQIIIMSVAAGICAANLWYIQPILDDIAKDFHTSESKVGMLSVLSQAGYGLGLFFITPYGDKVDRKKLVIVLHGLLIIALLGMAFFRGIYMAYVMTLIIGAMSSSAQVIIPMAAGLEKKNKGRVVGIVFTGLLIGILGARVFSGYVAHSIGWKSVYLISAGMVFIIGLLFYIFLPSVKPQFDGNYISLIKSSLYQIRRFPILRRISLLGALVFGLFTSFWTTLTFHLSAAPFGYKSDTIGLLGLVAIGGALLASTFGKIADKSAPSRSILITVSIIIIGILPLLFLPESIIAIIFSIFIIDIGVQGTQVTNIAVIYTLDEKANSRINTAYMTCFFAGGSLGSLIGMYCWDIGKWPMVNLQMLIFGLLALYLAYVHHKTR